MNKNEILNTLQMSDPYLGFKKDSNLNSFSSWNSDSFNFQLAKDKKTCLEIGSWMGGSAKTLSSIIPVDGALICCDNFLGSHEHFIDKTVPLNEYGKSMLYEYFLTNTYECREKIVPLMLSSSSAFEVFRRKGIKFDFIYIDGDHRATAVYNDIIESYSLLNHNGIILGDDYSWETVQEGVNTALKELQIGMESVNGQYIINRTV